MEALLRYPKHQRSAVAREWAHRSNAAQAAARLTRPIPWEDQLARARHDARGQVVREGCTYRAGATIPWRIVRSVHGQHRQFEIIVAGRLWRTGGARRINQWLKLQATHE